MTKLERPYLFTVTLLMAHQIDSAYWQEWKLFAIPGGVEIFVLLNVPLVLLFLYGFAQVVRGARAGARFALALASLGIAAFLIHVWFAWQGHPEFGLPTSWAILSGTLLSSVALGWRAMRTLRGQ